LYWFSRKSLYGFRNLFDIVFGFRKNILLSEPFSLLICDDLYLFCLTVTPGSPGAPQDGIRA
jgi:hypothetical protein